MRTHKDLSMSNALPIIEARNKLTTLPEELERKPGAVAVTRRGKPVLAILSWELYEAIVETLEILGDENLMTALRQGIKEMDEGRSIAWERAKKEL